MGHTNTEVVDTAGIDAMLADIQIADDILAETAGEEAGDSADIVIEDAPVEGEPGIEVEAIETADGIEIVASDEEMLGEIVGELDAAESRAAAYEAQESTAELDTSAAVPAKKGRGSRKAKEAAPEAAGTESPTETASGEPAAEAAPAAAARTPRMSLSDLKDENFVLEMDDVDRDLSVVRSEVMAKAPTAKKILEKFENLLVSIATGRVPSVYTMAGFKAIELAGEITTTDLVKAFTPKWTIGTARSQAQQVIQLFTALKVVTKTGNKLALNDKSVIAAALKAVGTAA